MQSGQAFMQPVRIRIVLKKHVVGGFSPKAPDINELIRTREDVGSK